MNYKTKKFSKLITVIILATIAGFFLGCTPKAAVKETSQEAVDVPEPKRITGLSTNEDAESIAVLVKGNQELTYTSVKQHVPPGVILYFPETMLYLDDLDTPHLADSAIIASIKTSELTGNGQTSRLEILLKQDVAYEISREDTDLKITPINCN